MTPHIPRHLLEQLLVDNHDRELRAHLDTCEQCASRLQALAAARAAFLERRDPADFARTVVERRRSSARSGSSRLRWLAASALAVAAAALLVWFQPAPETHDIRLKGSRSFSVFVQRDGHSEALEDGQPLAAGDQLAFAYALKEASHLLLLSIDDAGAVTRYYPADGSGGKLAATARAQLRLGVELDAFHGEERLVALFSRDPLDEAEARKALQVALHEAQARGLGISGMGSLPLAVEQTSVWFRKP